MDYLKIAREVIETESKGLEDVMNNLGSSFENAVNAVLNTEGKVVVSGMGKSGLIGQKISSTLASTGTPGFFMHPGEAFHGDLGMVTKNDIILLISYSGETDEVLQLLSFLKENTVISMTGNPASTLASKSDIHLNIFVSKEACPLELAPTASTTATLVMGDALAVALMKATKFDVNDFARYHPGGSIGRRLLVTAGFIMRDSDLPIAKLEDTIKDLIPIISNGRLGLIIVCENDIVQGIITDGDLRRGIEKFDKGFLGLQAREIMTVEPKCIPPEMTLFEIEKIMNDNKISSVLVTDNRTLLGVVQIYDIKKP